MSDFDRVPSKDESPQLPPAHSTRPSGPAGPFGDLLSLAGAAGNRAFTRAVQTGGPVTVARQAVGAVSTPTGEQPLEGDTVIGGTGDFYDKVRLTMGLVSTRLTANAGNYGVQVLNACESFTSYANSKIGALEDEITGEELAGELVGAALSAIGGQLTATIGAAAYKFVAERVSGYIQGKLTDGAKKMAGNGGDVAALKASIDGITQGARDAGTGASMSAQAALDGCLRPLFERCQARAPMLPEDDALVGPFWDVDPATMDQRITGQFGIPGAADAAVAQVEIYNALVRQFEKIYINKTSSAMQNFAMANQEMIGDWNLSLPGRAKAAAGAASRERAGALNVDWHHFAHAGRSYEDAARIGITLPDRATYDQERERVR